MATEKKNNSKKQIWMNSDVVPTLLPPQRRTTTRKFKNSKTEMNVIEIWMAGAKHGQNEL